MYLLQGVISHQNRGHRGRLDDYRGETEHPSRTHRGREESSRTGSDLVPAVVWPPTWLSPDAPAAAEQQPPAPEEGGRGDAEGAWKADLAASGILIVTDDDAASDPLPDQDGYPPCTYRRRAWFPACGATSTVDVPIHDGRSIRRDCAECGTMREFVEWNPRPEFADVSVLIGKG